MEFVDTPELRKARGAFFTPPAIADYFAAWAVGDDRDARVLDPSCGDGVFLVAAARRLQELGCSPAEVAARVHGVDVHQASLDESAANLARYGLRASFVRDDFFNVATPDQLGCPLPEMDAVVGNPPFVRYQQHAGVARARSSRAALAQGVRLTGLASSWAALVVHACAFLKPEGRLAMVLPAELLTVNYAEPVRRWLRRRFAAVNLVMFNRLQFEDALEKVVLVVARGSGGCDSFSLYEVDDAVDLARLRPFDHFNVTPHAEGKWTDILLPRHQRQLFRRVTGDAFAPLGEYGAPELGTVTGANEFFALTDEKRRNFRIAEDDVLRISPPGTRHLHGLTFTEARWETLRAEGERVWLLHPRDRRPSGGLRAYLALGEELGVPSAYKCRIRDPWWRPPAVSAPDLFFTYMSHRYPRLVANAARVTFVNSMHGVRLRRGAGAVARAALPLLTLNSVTMLGAELHGRSYGGGVLKMEPREAASLPVPRPDALRRAWAVLARERQALDRQLRDGIWTGVVKRVDEVLLREVLELERAEVAELHDAARDLRRRRLGHEEAADASA